MRKIEGCRCPSDTGELSIRPGRAACRGRWLLVAAAAPTACAGRRLELAYDTFLSGALRDDPQGGRWRGNRVAGIRRVRGRSWLPSSHGAAPDEMLNSYCRIFSNARTPERMPTSQVDRLRPITATKATAMRMWS